MAELTHNYRIDFPLAGETERRRLLLMERIDALKKDLATKGIKGKTGLKNLTCYAPYVTSGVCLTSVTGEEQALPNAIQEIKNENPEGWQSKVWIQKIFIKNFTPSNAKLEEEKLWMDAIKEGEKLEDFYNKVVRGEPAKVTRRTALEQREAEEKKREIPKETVQKSLNGKDIEKKLGKGIK